MSSFNKLAAFCGIAAVCASSGQVLAQDLPSMAGFVQVDGWKYHSFADGYTDDRWTEAVDTNAFGGLASIAIALGDKFSVQGDVWASRGSATQVDVGDWGTTTDAYNFGPALNAAGHLSWRPQDNMLIGLMLSRQSVIQKPSYASTVALEGAIGEESWRLSGQAGLIWYDSAIVEDRTLYAHARFAYYLQPNLSIAATAGASHRTFAVFSYPEYFKVLTLGARVEYKPDNLPITGFLAYQGGLQTDSDNYWGQFRDSTEHRATVGFRVAFGTEDRTLRQLDDAVGLYDANPYYGVGNGSR